MKKPITTTHNGRKFTLLSTGYFLDNNKEAEERLLHRIIWIEAFGPVPVGFDVHHKDEDKRNNAISNLVLKLHAVHRREHMLQAIERDGALRQRLTDRLFAARDKCHDWLQTDSGKDWSRNHLAQIRGNLRTYTCDHCKKQFQASVLSRHKFCSRKCGCRAAYESRKARLRLASVVQSEYSALCE